MAKIRAVLRRRWPLLALTAVLGVVFGVASTLVGPGGDTEQFEAEQVLVATSADSAQINVSQDELKVTRGLVPRTAAELLDEPARAEELARELDVSSDLDSNSITLIARDPDPERASDVVQAFAEGFLQVVNEQLRSEDARLLDELALRADDAAAALEAFDNANASVLRPDAPVQDSPALNALLAERERLVESLNQAESRYLDFELEVGERQPYTTLGPENPRSASGDLLAIPNSVPLRAAGLGVLGLALGIGMVLVIERVNRRIDTREELAAMISVPILASIDRLSPSKQPVDDSGRIQLEGPWSEDYRRVRSAIQFVQAQAGDAEVVTNGSSVTAGGMSAAHAGAAIAGHSSGHTPRVFMVVSAMPSEGKSTSTVLTALALAETGEDALIVNADFRRPMIEKYLGVPTSPSLADLAMLDPNRPSIEEVVQPGPVEHLWVASAGPPTLDVKHRLRAAADVATEAARQGGTVLIDSSPLRVTADPMDLLPAVDEVILVVRSGGTTVKSLAECIEMLDMHHAPVLGVVLVGTSPARDAGGYYYGSYADEDAVTGPSARTRSPGRFEEQHRPAQTTTVPRSPASSSNGRSDAPADQPAPPGAPPPGHYAAAPQGGGRPVDDRMSAPPPDRAPEPRPEHATPAAPLATPAAPHAAPAPVASAGAPFEPSAQPVVDTTAATESAPVTSAGPGYLPPSDFPGSTPPSSFVPPAATAPPHEMPQPPAPPPMPPQAAPPTEAPSPAAEPAPPPTQVNGSDPPEYNGPFATGARTGDKSPRAANPFGR